MKTIIVSISTVFIFASSLAQQDKPIETVSMPDEIRTIVLSQTIGQRLKNLFDQSSYYYTKTILVKDTNRQLKYYAKIRGHDNGCIPFIYDRYRFVQFNPDNTITKIKGGTRRTYTLTIKRNLQKVSVKKIDKEELRLLTHNIEQR